MQEALRFRSLEAEPVGSADYVEQARQVRRAPKRRPAGCR